MEEPAANPGMEPSPKRKAEEGLQTPQKQAKKSAAPTRVTLKNMRLGLRQKSVGWDRTMPVLRAMLGFQSHLAEHAHEPLLEVPEEHLGVIASLTQESDKSAADLAKLIRTTLLPEGHAAHALTNADGQPVDVLSISVIQNAIQRIATKENYGLDASSDDAPVPPGLQIWRWEVQDLHLLPKENLESLLARREQRVLAKQDALALFHALPQDTQQALLEGKKRPGKAEPSADHAEALPLTPLKQEPKPAEEPVSKEKSERTKLRESKRAERQAKEEKEEKGKQAQVRLLNSFFQQPSVSSPRKKDGDVEKSDFEKTFLPCEYKNMANINRFYRKVDDRLSDAIDRRQDAPHTLLTELKALGKHRRERTSRPRGVHPPVCVREIVKAVTESDVLGGDAEELAKRALAKLNNRRLLPIKLLQFQSDRRPGWVGTFTRSSTFITPRKPFGQDPVAFDYSYDSDAEWEEADEGENVDAMDEKEEEESAQGSEMDDSEMDDWLEDDLEVEEEMVPVEHDELPESPAPLQTAVSSTAVNILEPKKKIKFLGRRFDAKLVPYITGPHWEHTLGEPGHESFAQYHIQVLNDAYVGLDPFTFTSTTVTVETTSDEKPAQSSAGTDTTTPTPSSTSRAKSSFPDLHLPELLGLIQGSTRPKPALLEDLREHFGPIVKGVSKTAIESRLQECATKESKKPGARWIIKDEYKMRAAAGNHAEQERLPNPLS
ncbi:hypothetical protein MVES1_002208 [Malassezia vespertilionis]|uniref:Uncharacterized protein n=1 Tax=Malassezia vespertilionis TaxID=2020962 RepID=A0A2N1JC40_9BASI|nr:uncharacterized protein MVES1_002208 [Malassezia vespertilionis]PKI84105.1 hypothetical protein MVES_002085 [Malassezia vespertilionis]WFD06854.1 hypothetical protein MVES1_002208 [Malassezia vespertilionis]